MVPARPVSISGIIQPTDTGHHGIMVMDITDTISAKEALMPSQKENLMPMPGCIIPLMDTGLAGTMATAMAPTGVKV